jgi:hypothetical protein
MTDRQADQSPAHGAQLGEELKQRGTERAAQRRSRQGQPVPGSGTGSDAAIASGNEAGRLSSVNNRNPRVDSRPSIG